MLDATKTYVKFIDYFMRYNVIESLNFSFRIKTSRSSKLYYLDIDDSYIDSKSVNSFLKNWYDMKDLYPLYLPRNLVI